jgi:hypothetical protein
MLDAIGFRQSTLSRTIRFSKLPILQSWLEPLYRPQVHIKRGTWPTPSLLITGYCPSLAACNCSMFQIMLQSRIPALSTQWFCGNSQLAYSSPLCGHCFALMISVFLITTFTIPVFNDFRSVSTRVLYRYNFNFYHKNSTVLPFIWWIRLITYIYFLKVRFATTQH